MFYGFVLLSNECVWTRGVGGWRVKGHLGCFGVVGSDGDGVYLSGQIAPPPVPLHGKIRNDGQGGVNFGHGPNNTKILVKGQRGEVGVWQGRL